MNAAYGQDPGEPLLLWKFHNPRVDETVELWGEDVDGDYRLTMRGRQTMWIPKADTRELMYGLLRDHMRLELPETVTPPSED